MKFMIPALAAAAFIAAATPASATILSFDLTGSRQASFTLDTETAPSSFGTDPFTILIAGESATFNNVSGIFAGAPGVASISFGTNLLASLNINGIPALGFTQFAGPDLFSGSGSNPEFNTGTFALTSIVSGGSTLTISTVASAVPEPSTWAMMIIGFAGLGLASRRRQLQPQAA